MSLLVSTIRIGVRSPMMFAWDSPLLFCRVVFEVEVEVEEVWFEAVAEKEVVFEVDEEEEEEEGGVGVEEEPAHENIKN